MQINNTHFAPGTKAHKISLEVLELLAPELDRMRRHVMKLTSKVDDHVKSGEITSNESIAITQAMGSLVCVSGFSFVLMASGGWASEEATARDASVILRRIVPMSVISSINELKKVADKSPEAAAAIAEVHRKTNEMREAILASMAACGIDPNIYIDEIREGRSALPDSMQAPS
jgi:hypothetical protein